jgi:hypothetical protein
MYRALYTGYLGLASVQRKVRVFLRLLESRSFQYFNRQSSGDLSGTKARRLEGADPIYKAKKLPESSLGFKHLKIFVQQFPRLQKWHFLFY